MTTLWARMLVINAATVKKIITPECAMYFDSLLQQHSYKTTTIHCGDNTQDVLDGQDPKLTTIEVKTELTDIDDVLKSIGIKDGKFDIPTYINALSFESGFVKEKDCDVFLVDILCQEYSELYNIIDKELENQNSILTIEDWLDINNYLLETLGMCLKYHKDQANLALNLERYTRFRAFRLAQKKELMNILAKEGFTEENKLKLESLANMIESAQMEEAYFEEYDLEND